MIRPGPLRALLALGLAAGLLWSGPASARSLQDILDSGEIRICFAPLHPSVVSAEPAGCTDDCVFKGPVVDNVAAFVDTLEGVRPVHRSVGWDEQFWNGDGETVREASYTPALLASGACDIYPSNLTRIPWRETKLAILPYFSSRMMVIAGKNQDDPLRGPDDLGGRRAAAEPGTSYITWLEEANRGAYADDPIQITPMQLPDAIQAVEAGALDFTLLDADMAIWTVRNELQNATVAFPVGPMDEIGWAVRRDDLELQTAIRAFFGAQRTSGASELNQIWERHFGVSLEMFDKLIQSLPE